MKLLILLTLFFGIILVIHGIYEEKIKTLKKEVKVEYRFIPRSYYDEQIFSNQFSSKFSNLFDEEQNEWSANQRLIDEDPNTQSSMQSTTAPSTTAPSTTVPSTTAPSTTVPSTTT